MVKKKLLLKFFRSNKKSILKGIPAIIVGVTGLVKKDAFVTEK